MRAAAECATVGQMPRSLAKDSCPLCGASARPRWLWFGCFLHYVPLKCSACGGKIKVSVQTKVLAALCASVAAAAGWCLVRFADFPTALVFIFATLGLVAGQRFMLRLDAFE